MTSAKFSGFCTPSPPCPKFALTYSIEFMQPPLLHLLLAQSPPQCGRHMCIAPYVTSRVSYGCCDIGPFYGPTSVCSVVKGRNRTYATLAIPREKCNDLARIQEVIIRDKGNGILMSLINGSQCDVHPVYLFQRLRGSARESRNL